MLITKDEIVSIAINDVNFDTTLITDAMIQATERKHIAGLLGDALYSQILENQTQYADFLDGEAYEYSEKTYYWVGLKTLLAWLVVYENVDLWHNQIRNTGVQNPIADSSELGDVEKVKLNAWSKAMTYVDIMYDYIDRHADTGLYDNVVKIDTKIIGGFIL